MASLETRPDGPQDSIDRVTTLEMRVCELENVQLGLETQLADADVKILALQGQQRSDEKQFRAIAKRLKNLLIAQGIMILAIGTGLTGIKIGDEYQELFVGLLTTGILGAPFVALAKDPDEEPPRTPEELEE